MKLTTKLIICFGLFFILGMQAFASEIAYVTITNENCSRSAFYLNEEYDPNNPYLPGYQSINSVPTGTTQTFGIPLWTTNGNSVWVSAYRLDISPDFSRILKPNDSVAVTFHKEKDFPDYRCVPK